MEGTGMINGVPVRQDGRKLWQYLATISVCIMAVDIGTAMAWTSPILPKLYQADSWLIITPEQGSWVGSLLALGAIAGALPSGSIADKLGRKKSLLLLSAPFLLSWAIIILASQLWLIMAARFLVGIGIGAACVLMPIYVSEIAETSARGTLCALFQVFLTAGILLAFVLGSVTNYTEFAIVCAFVELIFLASFVWMPESPVWLVNVKRESEAKSALAVLRGNIYDPSEELAEMRRAMEAVTSKKSSVFDLIRSPATRRAMLATLGCMFFQQMSGINAVIFYTTTIFEESGSSIPADVASIIVALVQMVMSAVAAVIVDRAGRKPLLILSSGVMSVSLVALGLYFKIKDDGGDISTLGWLPLTSLTLYMIVFSVGMGPIPWLLMGEMFTAESKAIASGLAVMLNWFLVFLVTKTYPTLNQELGADATFWMFAAIMATAVAFTYFFIPETKGKSFQEIQDVLQNGTRLKSTV